MLKTMRTMTDTKSMHIAMRPITEYVMRRLQEGSQFFPKRLLLHKHQRNGSNASISTRQIVSDNWMTATEEVF